MLIGKKALIFLLIFSAAFSDVVVINSQDWKDVFYGIMYAHNNGYRVFFTNSPNPAGLLNILPKDNVILLEGVNAYVPNLDAQLKLKGYTIKEKIRLTRAYEQLMPKKFEKCYVVGEDFPYLSIPVGALARAEGAWVFIVDDDNAANVADLIKGKEVVQVGKLKRNVENVLKGNIKEKIDVSSKYDASIELAKRFMKVKETDQALLTEGIYLEPELLKGHAPVLFVGTNLLPDQILNFLIENKVKTVILIGPQLTYVGEQIRDKSGKNIAVFIKFGMSTPGVKPTIYALNLYPLPKPEIKLSITRASYDPDAKKVYIELRNEGNVGLFEFTTFRILRNGEEVASAGDEETVFIGAGETIVRGYNLALSDLTGNLTVEFYTSYGDSPENMNSYLTQGGKFAPPYMLPLEIKKTEDKSKLALGKVKYYRDKKAFAIEVINEGNVGAYAVVKLMGVKIQGVEQYLSSDIVKIAPQAKRVVYIRAKLDEIDESDNAFVNIEVDYGEKKDMLLKTIKEEKEVEYTSSGMLLYIAGGIAAAGVGFALIKMIKGKREESIGIRRRGKRRRR